MIQDAVYQRLSRFAYESELKGTDYIIKFKKSKQTWSVLSDIEHKKTGMDAKVFQSKSNIVIAFRGTEMNRFFGPGFKDVQADWDHVVLKYPVDKRNHPTSVNQFSEALKLTRKIKKKYPNSNITVTGHSLGGALASYVAAMESLTAVTYSSPAVLELLPKELQKKAVNGEYDSQIVNYVHPQDSIGAGTFSAYDRHIGSTYYVGSKYEIANAEHLGDPLKRFIDAAGTFHSMDNFTFDELGNLSNPILTNALNGEELWSSPRFSSDDKIELNPLELIELAEELKFRMLEMEVLHYQTKAKLLCHNHISRSRHIESELFYSLHRFYTWYQDRTGQAEYNLRLTASTMDKADKLV